MKKKNQPPKKCFSIFRKFSDYLDGELSDLDCREIKNHIQRCGHCRVCLETLKRTVELCRKIKTSRLPGHLKLQLKKLPFPQGDRLNYRDPRP